MARKMMKKSHSSLTHKSRLAADGMSTSRPPKIKMHSMDGKMSPRGVAPGGMKPKVKVNRMPMGRKSGCK